MNTPSDPLGPAVPPYLPPSLRDTPPPAGPIGGPWAGPPPALPRQVQPLSDRSPRPQDTRRVPAPTASECRLAALAHASPVLAFPIILTPLAPWTIRMCTRSAFVRANATHAANFNLTMWLISIVGLLVLPVSFALALGPLTLTGIVMMAHLVCAGIAGSGRTARYPLAIPFFRSTPQPGR